MDTLSGLRVFVATAQTGSLTAAAAQLGLSNRLCSKYVAELEARLGERLLQRTTRTIGLTPAGEALLARAPALLAELDDLFGSVSEGAKGFSGQIRVSAPLTFGEVYVAGMLNRFYAHHPALSIDLKLSDTFVDLAADGIDLAFRVGSSSAGSLKSLRLGETKGYAVASPAFIALHGAPDRPEDLAAHPCIIDTNLRIPTQWSFVRDDKAVSVKVYGRLRVNSARVARDLALAGQGIAFCPTFVLTEALAGGQLVRLLGDYCGTAVPINVVYLDGRPLSRRLRALVEFARTDIRKLTDF